MKNAVESSAGGERSIDTLRGAAFVPDPAVFFSDEDDVRGLCEGPLRSLSSFNFSELCAVFGRRLDRLDARVRLLLSEESPRSIPVGDSAFSSPIRSMSAFAAVVLSGANGLVNVGFSPEAAVFPRSIGDTMLGK